MVGGTEMKNRYVVGGRISFAEEKNAYTIQACNSRFLICTKPFNLQHTVLYSIVDLEQKIRGTENLIFGMGVETREQCEEMLERLTSGKTEVSYRNRIKLVEVRKGRK